MKKILSNEKKNLVPDAKPEKRWLTVEISKGISKEDTIRILEKVIRTIIKYTNYWDTQHNDFFVLFKEETDEDDGIRVLKGDTWRDIKRRQEELLSSCKIKALRDYVKSRSPIFPEDESATQEEFIRLNQRKKIKPE